MQHINNLEWQRSGSDSEDIEAWAAARSIDPASPGAIRQDTSRPVYINIEAAPALAKVLAASPELTPFCTQIRIESDSVEYDTAEDHPVALIARDAEYMALESVLNILEAAGGLKSFRWDWDMAYIDEPPQRLIPDSLWVALSKHRRTLVDLNLTFQMGHGSCWAPIFATQFPTLRRLEVNLQQGHGWHCRPLHDMLLRHPDLTSLALQGPACCGLKEFSLSSTHPMLRAFTYTGLALSNIAIKGDVPSSEFLKRHPSIEYLNLQYTPEEKYLWNPDEHTEDEYSLSSWLLDEQDLPKLRALSINTFGLQELSDVLLDPTSKRPLKVLEVDSSFILTQDIRCPSVECLHINSWIDTVRSSRGLPTHEPSVLDRFPALIELMLTARSFNISPQPEPLCGEDLINVLEWLSACNTPCLRVVTIKDDAGLPLPDILLTDLPPVPKTLEYLGWEVQGKMTLYRIQRETGRIFATPTQPLRPPHSERLWIDETVLDHFGEAAADW